MITQIRCAAVPDDRPFRFKSAALLAAIAFCAQGVTGAPESGDPAPCLYPTFDTIQEISDSAVSAMIAADLDNDGDQDIALLQASDASLVTLINDGTGEFSPGGTTPTGGNINQQISLVVADITGDGVADLLVHQFGTEISTFINDGSGEFAAGPILSTGSSGIERVNASDIDDDGDIDIILSTFGFENDIEWFRNNGDGTFTLQMIDVIANAPEFVAPGDIDNDGDIDLVVSHLFTSSLSIMLNDGNGDFPVGQQQSLPVPSNISIVDLVDVTGDGIVDLVAADIFGSLVRIYENDGAGSFTFVGEPPIGFGLAERAFADMNGDGLNDLMGVQSGGIALFPNVGGGMFADPLTVATKPGSIFFGLAALDGDGDVDIFAGSQLSGSSISFLANLGTAVDCNDNGIADGCEVVDNPNVDCNQNGIPDDCDIDGGASNDCNKNGIPDECETDCNDNGIADECELDDGTATDYNNNGVLDECEFQDCNDNGVNDIIETFEGRVADCNNNLRPDSCEIEEGFAFDDGGWELAYGSPNAAQILWAIRYDAGDGAVIDSVQVALVNIDDDPFPAGEPLYAYVWEDPNDDGLPDDAIVVGSTVTRFSELNDPDEGNPAIFQHIPIEPVAVEGFFFIGIAYDLDPDEQEFPIGTDENTQSSPNTHWFAGGVEGSEIQAAMPFDQDQTWMIRAGVLDCNDSGVLDTCEIAKGKLPDENNDGVADDCQCIAEITGDDEVGTADLLDLLAAWGDCPPDDDCPADLDGSSSVGTADLLLLLANWGPCE